MKLSARSMLLTLAIPFVLCTTGGGCIDEMTSPKLQKVFLVCENRDSENPVHYRVEDENHKLVVLENEDHSTYTLEGDLDRFGGLGKSKVSGLVHVGYKLYFKTTYLDGHSSPATSDVIPDGNRGDARTKEDLPCDTYMGRNARSIP